MLFKSAWISAAGAVLALIGSIATQAQAQVVPKGPNLSYAAKFVCGSRTADGSVVKGQYETTVNIHNPHFTPVQFQKKAVLALPQSSPPGAISKLVPKALKPDEALGVNCRDIVALFSPVTLPAFIEGFVVLYVSVNFPLDVVEVHTARHRGTAPTTSPGSLDVETLATRQVNPIRITVP